MSTPSKHAKSQDTPCKLTLRSGREVELKDYDYVRPQYQRVGVSKLPREERSKIGPDTEIRVSLRGFKSSSWARSKARAVHLFNRRVDSNNEAMDLMIDVRLAIRSFVETDESFSVADLEARTDVASRVREVDLAAAREAGVRANELDSIAKVIELSGDPSQEVPS